MNGKQYNNVIDWTLKHEEIQSGDCLEAAKAVLKNMGIALPGGSIKEVAETLKTDDYMGWRSCTMQQAQEYANNGTAAIGISEDRMVVLSAADEEDLVEETAAVMTLSETTPAYAVSDLQYYANSRSSTGGSGGSSGTNKPKPHGTYLSFSCTKPAVCNDGIGDDHGDPYHDSDTSYMNGSLNADVHRFIVIPGNVNGYASLRGCVGVAVRNNGQYVFGVVGDVGPYRPSGTLDEFSVKMIKDLGFMTDGANYVDPEETVRTYIFPDTQRDSWPSATLNNEVEAVGRARFY